MNLKKLREASGLTQSDLAEKLNLKTTTYWGYETQARQMDYQSLIKIADYFNCSIDYLLDHKVEQQSVANSPLQKKLIYQITQLDDDLCEIAEATIEGLYQTNQERKVLRDKLTKIQAE